MDDIVAIHAPSNQLLALFDLKYFFILLYDQLYCYDIYFYGENTVIVLNGKEEGLEINNIWNAIKEITIWEKGKRRCREVFDFKGDRIEELSSSIRDK